MTDVFIAGPVRTAVGKFGGSFTDIPVQEMGAKVVAETLTRAGVAASEVEEVILGNVLSAGLGQNPARQAAVKAGIPVEAPAFTVSKVCGSGLKAVQLGAQAIRCGDADVVIAGGMENMSRVPFVLDGARWGYRMGDGAMVDSMIRDGLWDAFNNYHMGITAENVAAKYGITREDQDNFSYSSQMKTAAAQKDGSFKAEIIPIMLKQRKGDPKPFDVDEFPRAETTLEGLGKLKPAFKKDGTVTAGNASGINDGAAAVTLLSGDKMKALGVKPVARILACGTGGVAPSVMGLGPVPAIKKALERAKMSLKDIQLFELNEAFAAQSLGVIRELQLEPMMDIINIHGGAISLGHPIGCSGARILVTLLYAMAKKNASVGLAALCIGGGQGASIIVERV